MAMAELGVLVIGFRGRVDPLYALRPYHTAVANTGIETRMRRVILGAECIADDDARDTTQIEQIARCRNPRFRSVTIDRSLRPVR
jgi:hypothetical protein